jgi:hypothetical protein
MKRRRIQRDEVRRNRDHRNGGSDSSIELRAFCRPLGGSSASAQEDQQKKCNSKNAIRVHGRLNREYQLEGSAKCESQECGGRAAEHGEQE